MPTPAPTSVGQSVPDCGREGAGVEVDVPPQIQLMLLVQSGFRQNPLKQTKSDEQLKLLPQVPPHEFGTAEDVGVGDSVEVGVGLEVEQLQSGSVSQSGFLQTPDAPTRVDVV